LDYVLSEEENAKRRSLIRGTQVEKVLAAVTVGLSKTEIRDFPMTDIPEDSALMKMEVAGICGTTSMQGRGMEEKRWRSVDEIAVHLGVSRETVYRWIGGKRLPAHRIGKFWKFKIAEVDAWVRAGNADEDAVAAPRSVATSTKGATGGR